MKYLRYLKTKLLDAFKTSPVSLLIGPRQSGKTTLMRELAAELGMYYLTKEIVAPQKDRMALPLSTLWECT